MERLERLGIWLSFSVGGVGLLVVAMTLHPDTPAVLLGVLYVLGFALLAVGVMGFASEVVVAVHGRLQGTGAELRLKPLPVSDPPIATAPAMAAWDPTAIRLPSSLAAVPRDQLSAKADELMAERRALTRRGEELQYALSQVSSVDRKSASLEAQVQSFRRDLLAHRERWWPDEANAYPYDIKDPDPFGVPAPHAPYWRAVLENEMGDYMFWLLNHDALI